MQGLNWTLIIILTIASSIGGSIWYGPIFGKLWQRIHHGDKKFSKEEMQKLMEGMWKLILVETVAIFLTIIGLACVIRAIPEYSGVQTAVMVWIAFTLPMATSAVLWGNDAKKWMATKIALMGSYRLIVLVIAGYLIDLWK